MSSVSRTVRRDVGSTAPTLAGPSRNERRKRRRSLIGPRPPACRTPAHSGRSPVGHAPLLKWSGIARLGCAAMAALALGAIAAVTASVLFSAGLLLQSREARTIPVEHALRLSLIARLLHRPRWVLGGLVMVAGFGFHVGALALAPLAVVQPSLAAGLVVLVIAGARAERQRITRREAVAVVVISLGVAGVTLTASEQEGITAGPGRIALALGPLALVALLPHALARVGHRPAGSLAPTLGAGAAYALTGLTTNFISDRLQDADWLVAALWLGATVIAAALALVDQTTALQRRAAAQVGVVIYVMPVIVPVLLAPAVLGEDWARTPAAAAPLGLSV